MSELNPNYLLANFRGHALGCIEASAQANTFGPFQKEENKPKKKPKKKLKKKLKRKPRKKPRKKPKKKPKKKKKRKLLKHWDTSSELMNLTWTTEKH